MKKPRFLRQRRSSNVIKALLLIFVVLLFLLLILIITQLRTRSPNSLSSSSHQGLDSLSSTEPGNEAALTDASETIPQPDSNVETADIMPQSTTQFASEPLCFSGSPDYEYKDDRLAVRIKEKQEAGIVYFVCDIQTTDPSAIHTAFSGGEAYGINEHTSAIAARNDAVLAINGDCYSFHAFGTIIRNGQILRSKDTTRHMLTLDQNGDLAVITDRTSQDPETLGDMLLAQGITQTWEFGPELIRNGQTVPLNGTGFDLLSTRDNVYEPRTAIGQIGPLHYVIIVVDGRIENYSTGASLSTLQRLFREAGAQTAFNLDGGGSTTLYFNGNVINRPSGGHERSVSDILYF